ncbi:MAG: sugar transferase [Gemmatimonadales bacterium]|nr:sugar transferase [Gemmatimonadales bacterium]
MFAYKHFKRAFDFTLSFFGVVILSPVFLFIAVLIKLKLGSPVFFIQKRPGIRGNIFNMVKFRTMLNSTDNSGKLLPNIDRHTKFGKLLRSTSMDELPELFNVVKGDMSLIGPRPLLIEYLPLYNKSQARRHDVKPGITGLAQVKGRNSITWEDRFDYDIHYVNNMSVLLDLRIFLQTMKKVFLREGVNFESETQNNRFLGS